MNLTQLVVPCARSELNAPLSDSNCWSLFIIWNSFIILNRISVKTHLPSAVDSNSCGINWCIVVSWNHPILRWCFPLKWGSMECNTLDCFVVRRIPRANTRGKKGKEKQTDLNGATRIFGWLTGASIAWIVPVNDANNFQNNQRLFKNTKTTWNKRSSFTETSGRTQTHATWSTIHKLNSQSDLRMESIDHRLSKTV